MDFVGITFLKTKVSEALGGFYMSFVRKVVSLFGCILVIVFFTGCGDVNFLTEGYNVSDDCEIIGDDFKDDFEKEETSEDASFFTLFEETSGSEPSGIEFEAVFVRKTGESGVVDAVYRDVSTGVMYVWIDSGYSGTGLSVMLNAEGSPLIYHEKIEDYDFSDRFEQVYDDVFVDIETKVMYLRADGAGCSGISVMFGSDGKPLTYKEGISKS